MKHLALITIMATWGSGLLWGGELIFQPSSFPWTVGLTPTVLSEPGGLSPGESTFHASSLWFNTYRWYGNSESASQIVDMEGLLESFSWTWAPVSHWELRTQASAWAVGGGISDAWFRAIHHWLGVPNQGRDDVANNQYQNFVSGLWDDTVPSWGLTQASVGGRWFSGPWSVWSWIKIPVPAHVGWGWSDRWGTGTSLSWGQSWFLVPGGNLGFGFTGAVYGVQPDGTEGSDFSGGGQIGGYATWTVSQGPRFLVEAVVTSVPRSGEAYWAMPSGLSTFGIQVPLGKKWIVEAAFHEEFLTWATLEAGVQVGFQTGIN